MNNELLLNFYKTTVGLSEFKFNQKSKTIQFDFNIKVINITAISRVIELSYNIGIILKYNNRGELDNVANIHVVGCGLDKKFSYYVYKQKMAPSNITIFGLDKIESVVRYKLNKYFKLIHILNDDITN